MTVDVQSFGGLITKSAPAKSAVWDNAFMISHPISAFSFYVINNQPDFNRVEFIEIGGMTFVTYSVAFVCTGVGSGGLDDLRLVGPEAIAAPLDDGFNSDQQPMYYSGLAPFVAGGSQFGPNNTYTTQGVFFQPPDPPTAPRGFWAFPLCKVFDFTTGAQIAYPPDNTTVNVVQGSLFFYNKNVLKERVSPNPPPF